MAPDIDYDKLAKQVAEELHRKMVASGHVCRVPVSDESLKVLATIIGTVKDIGDGDGYRGSRQLFLCVDWTKKRMEDDEEYKANHVFTSELRTVKNATVRRIMVGALLVLTLLGVLATLGFLGMLPRVIQLMNSGGQG